MVHGHPSSFLLSEQPTPRQPGRAPDPNGFLFAVNGVITQSPFRQSFPSVPNLHSSPSLRETHGGARGIYAMGFKGGVAPGAGGWMAGPLAARSCSGLGGFGATGWRLHPSPSPRSRSAASGGGSPSEASIVGGSGECVRAPCPAPVRPEVCPLGARSSSGRRAPASNGPGW